MKKLIIMPGFTTHKLNKGRYHFPFSIWYLGSYLKAKGEDVDICDLNVSKLPDIKKYDWIGISCITAQVPATVKLLRYIRKTSKAKIVLGGVHPTLYPLQTKVSPLVDEVVIGHAIKDFGCMPPLDYSLLDKDMMKLPKDYVGLVTSLGCSFKCSFCVNSIVKEYNEWKSWTAERIIAEIEKAFTLGFRNIFFWDDNFFVDKTRVRRFISYARKLRKFEWFAFTRATSVDKETFKECYEVGLRRVSIGAESGSDRMLKLLNKGITVNNIEQSAKILNNLGIEASYSYMIGLPDEKKEDIELTVKHLGRMAKIQDIPKIVGPMLYCPYPGSKLYDKCVKSGWKEPNRLELWTNETTGNVDTPYDLPWIKEKDLTQVYWFYSFLAVTPIFKILRNLVIYSHRTKNMSIILLMSIPLIFGRFLAYSRAKLRLYKYPFETLWLKKLKTKVGA